VVQFSENHRKAQTASRGPSLRPRWHRECAGRSFPGYIGKYVVQLEVGILQRLLDAQGMLRDLWHQLLACGCEHPPKSVLRGGTSRGDNLRCSQSLKVQPLSGLCAPKEYRPWCRRTLGLSPSFMHRGQSRLVVGFCELTSTVKSFLLFVYRTLQGWASKVPIVSGSPPFCECGLWMTQSGK